MQIQKRFNKSYYFWETGYWYMSKRGRPLWKHQEIIGNQK